MIIIYYNDFDHTLSVCVLLCRSVDICERNRLHHIQINIGYYTTF